MHPSRGSSPHTVVGFGSRLTGRGPNKFGSYAASPGTRFPSVGPAVCTTYWWPGVVRGAGPNWARTGGCVLGCLRPVAEVEGCVHVPVHDLPASLAGEALVEFGPARQRPTAAVMGFR